VAWLGRRRAAVWWVVDEGFAGFLGGLVGACAQRVPAEALKRSEAVRLAGV
jgi:hypothetical protein